MSAGSWSISPKVRRLLADALLAGERIFSLSESPIQADSWVTESAIYHQFTIIGEVFIRLRELDPELAEELDGHRIVGFRNLVVHGYDAVDFVRVQALIDTDLKTLVQQIEACI